MTPGDLKRLQEAADHLKRAANLLYQVGRDDCVALGERIEPFLDGKDGTGLLPLIKRLEESRRSDS